MNSYSNILILPISYRLTVANCCGFFKKTYITLKINEIIWFFWCTLPIIIVQNLPILNIKIASSYIDYN